MDTKGLQKEFINWCKSKNKLPKSEDETKQLFVAFMKEKHPEEYKQAMENQQKQQATKALHGAKLNYFKSLKHQCAEDEEVVYYKKGGSVTCGCKKKENGGEVKKNCGGSVINNFKTRKGLNGMEAPTENKTATKQPKPQPQKVKIYWTDLDDRKLDSLVTRKEIQKKALTEQGEKDLKSLREKFKKAANKDQYEVDASEQPSKKCGGKVKKHQEGSIIDKFKALRNGGSLNGIPFYRGGTPKEGIEKSDNTTIQKPFIPYTLVKPQLLPQITVDGIRKINLPNFTVIGQNLNKTYPFPYGEIIVEKSPENGKTISYPTTNSPLGLLVMKSKAIRNARGNRDGEIF